MRVNFHLTPYIAPKCPRLSMEFIGRQETKKPRKRFVFQGFYNLSAFAGMLFGSPARTRTTDAVVNSHLLCQLSYWGITVKIPNPPEARWLIPPSAGLCQLSYWGILANMSI